MFCKNCGKELEDSSKFCKHCGADQYSSAEQYSNTQKRDSKIFIVLAVIAFIVLIVLCFLYKYGQEDKNNNNFNNKENELQADHSDNKGSTVISDNNDPEQDTYKNIASTKISIDGKACSNGKAAYTYEASYGNMFAVTCPFSNNNIMLIVVVPKNMCEAGMSLSDQQLREKAFLDLCIIGEINSVEYDSVSTPDVFSNMNFEMGQYTQDKEAGFIVNTEFVYEGNTYHLEASAAADYSEYQGNQGGTSGNTQNQTCLYCNGGKKCYLCHGLGYTAWGGTQVDCNSCGGTGICYYCEGTGREEYMGRGYKKNN